jgi:anthranilate phosphoribosyltransferase
MRTVYDEIADVFMTSLAAEVSGVTRGEIMRRMREKWPTEEQARAAFEEMSRQAEALADEARRDAAKRGHVVVGIGYRVK